MKKWVTALAVILILLMPLVALKARSDAAEEMRRPELGVYRSEGRDRLDDMSAASYSERACTAQECIEAMNAGYEQMWARENNSSFVETARYPISNTERREIEEIVASEGGYCSYEFQALVALCILNGAEAENMRPSELFKRGDFRITHDVEPTETTKQAVSDVFDLGIFPTDEPVRYYYNPDYCYSAAHESFCYVLTYDGCRFFKDYE